MYQLHNTPFDRYFFAKQPNEMSINLVKWPLDGSMAGVTRHRTLNGETRVGEKVNELSLSHPFSQLANGENALDNGHPTHIIFHYPLTETLCVMWHSFLLDNNLYIEAPGSLFPHASNEAFVAVLDYAEEILKCNNVVFCVQKDRSDRALVVRTFMFIGCYVCAPEGDLALPFDDGYVFLIYSAQ